MPAFQAEQGMPFWIDLTTSDIRKSSKFYSDVLGWEVEEISDTYRLCRIQGLPVAGLVARPEDDNQPDTWVTYFLAWDLEAACAKVEELGGRVLVPATEVALGEMAVAVDTSGAMFGLMKPQGEESFIAAGEPGTPVWHELTAVAAYDKASSFYAELFEWVTAELEGPAKYTTALVDGAAFAGIYDAHGQFPPQVPSFWQSYLGVLSVDEAVAKVPDLGGDVIREPWESEFGRLVIIGDSTGATVTLCEVAEPVEEGSESDPLEGIDLSQFGL